MPGLRLTAVCLVFVSAVLACSTAHSYAAVGLPMLRLNTGPRGASMGDAMAAVPDPNAGSVNPAALASSSQRTLALGHTAWIQGTRHNHVSLVTRRGGTVWALAAQVSQTDGLERRTGPSTDPLGEFGVYDGSLSVSAARRGPAGLRLGVGFRLIRQSILVSTASGASLDLGLTRQITSSLLAGVSARHLGGMGKLERESTGLPTVVRGGLAYSGHSGVLVSLEAQAQRDADLTLHAGAEYALEHGLALRAGYQTTDGRGLTGGMGLTRGRWTVDYAYIPFDYGLGDAHRLSLQLQLSEPR